MKIPARLATLLRKDRSLESSVHASIEEFLPWLQSSGKRPLFFPDYTDHSIQHIEEVLHTAASLIRDDAWRALTPADVAVLVLATLLHDSAMHMSDAGFEALVRPGTPWIPLDGFDDQEWPKLWVDFCMEARRFDQRKLWDLFGDSAPVTIPGPDLRNLDDRSRRLIGEFIRRHHPRLAHEIALHGVPGMGGELLRLHTDEKLADLAGLVARSHGLPARACLPYLQEKHHSRVDPYGVHAVFLMALLRVADYLQIQPSRAPTRALRVHRIHSPYSAVEWKVHASVTQVQESDDDPEAVRIIAEPMEVATYLRVKGWLAGLQSEIDASWAVLGEVFSRQRTKKLEKLGIRLRRILSNLDDASSFIPGVPYLRRHVTFTVNSADLLKLMIGPFYGERPEIGVRELVQNGVDAVRELNNLRVRGLAPGSQAIRGIEADVLVALEQREESWWLTVSDQGIGMTPEVVCNYFLRAGASFRNSDSWLRRFTDSDGASVVVRTGRFGVGALAAFLLGDEIYVSTRYYEERTGLAFSAEIDSPAIEIRPMDRPTGTTISVKIQHNVARELIENENWDWYCLRCPSVRRVVRARGVPEYELPQRHLLPSENEPLSQWSAWRRFSAKGFEDAHWTYDVAPRLTCNGIHVPAVSYEYFPLSCGIPLRIPSVSVFDPDGLLPLNLQRSELIAREYPFQEKLLRAVLRDYIAFAIMTAPSSAIQTGGNLLWYNGLFYPGEAKRFTLAHFDHGGWCSAPAGIVPLCAPLLWNLEMESIVLLPLVLSDLQVKDLRNTEKQRVATATEVLALPASVPVACIPCLTTVNAEWNMADSATRLAAHDAHISTLYETMSVLLDGFVKPAVRRIQPSGFRSGRHDTDTPSETFLQIWRGYDIDAINMVVPRKHVKTTRQLLQMTFVDNLGTWRDLGGNFVWTVAADGLIKSDLAKASSGTNLPTNPLPFLDLVLRRRDEPLASPPTLFEVVWSEVMGKFLIPYSRIERTNQLTHALHELRTHIEAYRDSGIEW